MLLDKDDVNRLFDGKVDCFGSGATFIGTSLAAATIASAVITSAMAPKPPQMPDNSAFMNQQTVQAKKAADTSSTAAIKAAKKASGASTPNTLLSGGVSDDELNTGNNLLG